MNTRAIVIIIALVAILGSSWFFLSMSNSSTEEPSSKEFVLRVENKELVEGPSALTVRQGDTVTIRITSDVQEELHLHGYDRSVDLVPNQSTSLTFVATMSGRFPYELENSKTEIGALEVFP